MFRFYHTNLENNGDIVINDNLLLMDGDIWQNCRSFLQGFDQKKRHVIELIPVRDAEGELTAYGYQDHEANRELRMLRELRENAQALQFTDIFPEYQEVIIWGCNELAFFFAEYLKEQGITVSVIGQYWNCFGYETCGQRNSLGGDTALVVYAEGIPLQNNSLYETVTRSVSPEFECIDKIYEANVLEGRIHDTIGGFDEFINRLKEENEIVILGADMQAQDTYDLLMTYGIDICGFAVRDQSDAMQTLNLRGFAMQNESDEMRLGKKIMSVEEAMRILEHPVFLNYTDVHGALGEEWTEYFDYSGFERNKQYYLVRDYADIPTSNLIHVLRGKNVWLTGDAILCQLLSDYLNSIENGEVNVKFILLGERVSMEKEDILCLVIPDCFVYDADMRAERDDVFKKKLSNMKLMNYTTYFCHSYAFALVDMYLNRNGEKYTVPELSPKGILLGIIPSYCGSDFIRGILDGHPEIILFPRFSEFNDRLFWYCIRLANIESDKVVPNLREMYNVEASDRTFFSAQFWERLKILMGLKDRFTSQELFVLFHIAYTETVTEKQISDITNLVIYWEPHCVFRDESPYYALWLEDAKLRGQTMLLRRNNIARLGSWWKYRAKELSFLTFHRAIFLENPDEGENHLTYRYWTEFKMRFEDIKVNPKEKLMEICEQLEIEWSDNMLHTTSGGEGYISCGSMDFELRPVFNKYENYFSSFDRFRIYIASSAYQKKYGYSYDDCLSFSRRELLDMFMKPFLFEKTFDGKNRHKILEYIKNHDKLILYGIGNNCQGLLRLVDESVKRRLLYSDKKAESESVIFRGRNVIAPRELSSVYKDYNILVTSNVYSKDIEHEFENIGIDPSRVYYIRETFELDICEWVGWQLWNVRKHMVLDDVYPEFDRFELKQTGEKYINKEIDKSTEYIRSHNKLILYGIGGECCELLELLEEETRNRLLYSDKKADSEAIVFRGKNVIAPKELCSVYKDYNILVTSSVNRRSIEYEFENMGIDSSRVYYNKGEFVEGGKVLL